MVDVIKAMGIEYVAFNPGSSFEGLHECSSTTARTAMPEIITCCHEEVGMGDGSRLWQDREQTMLALLQRHHRHPHAAMANLQTPTATALRSS